MNGIKPSLSGLPVAVRLKPFASDRHSTLGSPISVLFDVFGQGALWEGLFGKARPKKEGEESTLTGEKSDPAKAAHDA